VIADSRECAAACCWEREFECSRVDVVFYLKTHNATNIDALGGLVYWGL